MSIISLDEPENRNKDDQPTYKEKCDKYVAWLNKQIKYYEEEFIEATEPRKQLELGMLRYQYQQARGRFNEIFGE